MARVVIPRITGQYPTGAPAVPVDIGIAGQYGRTVESVGRVLSSLGGDFATLAERMSQSEVNSEAALAKASIYKGMADFEISLLNSATAPTEWGKAADETFSKAVETESAKLRTEAARKKLKEWAEPERYRQTTQFTFRGWQKNIDNVRDSTYSVLQAFVDADDLEGFYVYVDEQTGDNGPFSVDAATELKHRALISHTERGADSVLDAKGVKETVKYIQSRDDLSIEDKAGLIKRANQINDQLGKKHTLINEQERIDTTNDLYSRIDSYEDDTQIMPKDLDLAKEKLGKDEGDKWQRIWDGRKEETPEKTDWKKYIRLRDILFDLWAGKAKTEAQKKDKVAGEHIKTSFARARYDNGYLTDDEWKKLKGYVVATPDMANLDLLRSGWNEIERLGRTKGARWILTGADKWLLSQGEARTVAKAQDVFFSWLSTQLSRNKDITPEEVTARATSIYTAVNDEPDTLDEFKSRVAYLKSVDMSTAKEYYDLWIDKWPE